MGPCWQCLGHQQENRLSDYFPSSSLGVHSFTMVHGLTRGEISLQDGIALPKFVRPSSPEGPFVILQPALAHCTDYWDCCIPCSKQVWGPWEARASDSCLISKRREQKELSDAMFSFDTTYDMTVRLQIASCCSVLMIRIALPVELKLQGLSYLPPPASLSTVGVPCPYIRILEGH